MSRYEDQSASTLWPDAAPRSMNGASEKASVRKLRNHSLRYALNNELHARPFMPLRSPERIAHLAGELSRLRHENPADWQRYRDTRAELAACLDSFVLPARRRGDTPPAG